MVLIFCGTTVILRTAFTLLGTEYICAAQVATELLSSWVLETLCSSTVHLRMPHRCFNKFRSGNNLASPLL